jgi:hypothetical protein
VRSSDSKLAAVQAAHDAGHPEVSLMILKGTVRTYTRTPKSPAGWQVSNVFDPYPKGTAAVVLVDAYDVSRPPGFYVVPIEEIREIILARHYHYFPDGKRPVSPDATHGVVTVESVAAYRDAWAFYVPS